MSYAIKEIFFTLQGEGMHSGRPAVFCRFSGCNLWSGVEAARATAICQFCDTDFVGMDGTLGGRYSTPAELADTIASQWPGGGVPFVVCTGGEPLLQLDDALVLAIHERGFEISVESNGTIGTPPDGIDWLCVSPKGNAELNLRHGNELKLVYPQISLRPEQFEHLDFARFSLQPMDGPDIEANTRAALAFCLQRPQWQLSLQTHKILGIR
jgi:7-carboxy-7-deazaguanine synthase (Cx14CxxC type)